MAYSCDSKPTWIYFCVFVKRNKLFNCLFIFFFLLVQFSGRATKTFKNNFHQLFLYTLLFYKQHSFSTQSQCFLTFPWFEVQMLLRCCLICIHLLYLGLGLFMSYLSDLFFIFIFMINRIILWIQPHLFPCLCPIAFGLSRWWKMLIIFKWQKFSLRVLLSNWLISCQFQLALLIKVLLIYIKKRVGMCNQDRESSIGYTG